FDVDNHNFLNRDRFVVSAGHSSALYYTMLHMFDMGISAYFARPMPTQTKKELLKESSSSFFLSK
ncbi:MAG: hypothetical protein IIW17_04260, partial [Clostridia bacterium]|nr:hypothetical protein [Clostridia bacterium]MBQ5793211.1 hypothetical protein [Clostridia bacterium]